MFWQWIFPQDWNLGLVTCVCLMSCLKVTYKIKHYNHKFFMYDIHVWYMCRNDREWQCIINKQKNLILLNKVKFKALLKHKIVKFSNVSIYVLSQFCPIPYRTWQEKLPAMAWLLVWVVFVQKGGTLRVTVFSVVHILFTTNYGWVLETFWPFHVYWSFSTELEDRH